MSNQKEHVFRKYPLISFYLLAFIISWIGWIPQTLYSYKLFPFNHYLFSLLGGAGPTLAAVLVSRRLWGKDGSAKVFNALFRWKFSWMWYLVPLLFWSLITAGVLIGGSVSGLFNLPLKSYSWYLLPSVFATMLLSNVWEEIGWRGFALPRFQKGYSDGKIALIMGLTWSLWHLPLMLDPFSPMSDLSWGGEFIFSLALSVIYIWLFNNSRGSLIPVTLFHALSNTAAFVFLELGIFEASYLWVVGFTSLAALGILFYYGPRRFSRNPEI